MKELFLNLLEVSAAMAVIIALVVLLSAVIDKKFSVKWKYWVWLFIAIRLAIPFSPDFETAEIKMQFSVPDKVVYYRTEEVAIEPEQGKAEMVFTPVTGEMPVVTTPEEVKVIEKERYTVLDILGFIWFSGGALFFIWYIGAYFFFRKKHLENSFPTGNETEKAVLTIKNELGINNDFETLISKNVTSPMVMGFIKPKLILPEEDFEPEELSFILRHELTHYKRHDTLYKAVLLFVNALHWFNPMVWIMREMAGTDLELSCDSSVVHEKDLDIRVKYSKTILACVHREKTACTVFSTHFYGGAKTLKKRFANILSTESRKKGTFTFCAVLMLTSVLGGLISCSAAYNEPSEDVIKELLVRADAVYQKGNYDEFEKNSDEFEKNSDISFLYDGKFYYSVENYDEVLNEIFTENAIKELENTVTKIGKHPIYIEYGGRNFKLRAEVTDRETGHYDYFHWIKLVKVEDNRFTYRVCHSGESLVVTGSEIVIVNEKGDFKIDEFESHRDYIIPEDSVSSQTSESDSENYNHAAVVPVPEDMESPDREGEMEEEKETVFVVLEENPDPLSFIPNLSTAPPKKFPQEKASDAEMLEIGRFLYSYYSTFATLREPDFTEFEGGGADFTLLEQMLRCYCAKQRINKTFWKDFDLEIKVLSKKQMGNFRMTSYEIKCDFTVKTNYGAVIYGTDFWDIELNSKASSKSVFYMSSFEPSQTYGNGGIYSLMEKEFIETAERFPEYSGDLRKLADLRIAEYCLGY